MRRVKRGLGFGPLGEQPGRGSKATAIEIDRDVGQLDKIHDIGRVVEDQRLQRGLVSPAITMPEADGFKAIHPLDRGVAVQAEPAFDGLEPPLMAQRGQDKPQVDMGLVELGRGEVARKKGTSNWLPLKLTKSGNWGM